MTDWENKQHDLEVAEEIIVKHLMFTDDNRLSLFHIIEDESNEIRCQPAAWLLEVAQCFHDKYGIEQGLFVTKKIISRCLVANETIH